MRLSKEDYNKKAMAVKAAFNVEDWANWSLRKQSIENITVRAIMTATEGREYLCFTYLLNNNHFEEEDLKDLIYINSGLFDWNSWNDETVEYVFNLMQNGTKFDILPSLHEVVSEHKMSDAFCNLCQSILDREFYEKLEKARKSYSALFNLISDTRSNIADAPMFLVDEPGLMIKDRKLKKVPEMVLAVRDFNDNFFAFCNAHLYLINKFNYRQMEYSGNLPSGWSEKMFRQDYSFKKGGSYIE